MKFRVESYKQKNKRDWEEFIGQAPGGTLFHRRKFLSYHPSGRFTDGSLLVYRGDNLIAVMPAAVMKQSDGVRILHSHPGATVGGVVTAKDIGIHGMTDIVRAIGQHAGENGFQRIGMTIPPAVYSGVAHDDLEFVLRHAGATYGMQELCGLLDLSGGYQPGAALRRALRKAEKNGVVAHETHRYPEFFRILRQNLAFRHNVKPTHTLKELQDLRHRFPDDIRLFGAFCDNRLTAGVVVFVCNQSTALGFYMSHDPQYSHLRVMDAVMDGAIQWVQAAGCRVFDFGIFTKQMTPNWGLGRFKEKFGAHGVLRNTLWLDVKR